MVQKKCSEIDTEKSVDQYSPSKALSSQAWLIRDLLHKINEIVTDLLVEQSSHYHEQPY